MLLYHASTKTQFQSLQDEWTYSSHREKEDFFYDLESIGSFPQYCKTMALSNGSLIGEGQSRPYDGAFRNANDLILDFEGDIYARILGTKIKVFALELELRSNPNGNGKVFEISAGTWGVRPRLYWVGIDINVGLNSLTYKEINARNLVSWDVESGGNLYIHSDFIGDLVSAGNGTYNVQVERGTSWSPKIGRSLTLLSDGLHFNFVPTASALDWGDLELNTPISPDIAGTPWPQKVYNSPFDIISGITPQRGFPNVPYSLERLNIFRSNLDHLFVSNHRISSPLSSCPELTSYIINREIGDEIMYLNNRELPYSSRFEVDKDIFVNSGHNNPHYEYSFGAGPQLTYYAGYYSKEEPFEIVVNPYSSSPVTIELKYGNQYFLNAPLPSQQNFKFLEAQLNVCCKAYWQYKKEPTFEPDSINHNPIVYPNPTTDWIIVKTKKSGSGKSLLSIINSSGQVLISAELSNNQQNLIDTRTLIPGVYQIIISDVNQFYTYKLIKL